MKRRALLLLFPLAACSTYATTNGNKTQPVTTNDAGTTAALDASTAADSGSAPVEAGADAASADFTVSAEASLVTVRQLASATVTMDITRAPGTSGAVTVDFQQVPFGASASPVTIPADQTSAVMTLNATSGAVVGDSMVTAHAVLGTTERTATFTLRVSLGRGAIDASYGNNGVVDVKTTDGGVRAWTFGADGSVYAAVRDSTFSHVKASRVTSAGVADASWGDSGGVVVAGPGIYPVAVALDSTKRLLVFGQDLNGGSLYVIRFDAMGHYDPSFNITIAPPAQHAFDAVVIGVAPDDRIVLIGFDTKDDTGHLYQYTASGVADPSFTAPAIPSNNYFDAIAFDAAGNTYLAGNTGLLGTGPIGTAYASIDAKGALRYPVVDEAIDAYSTYYGVAPLPDGRVLLGGAVSSDKNDFSSSFLVTRFTAAGARDMTFGGTGAVTNHFSAGALDVIYDVASDGSVLGVTGQTDNNVVVVGLYDVNGVLDTTFADHGFMMTAPQFPVSNQHVLVTKAGLYFGFVVNDLSVQRLGL
jgi:uncharacterized delta-60 repeat protein